MRKEIYEHTIFDDITGNSYKATFERITKADFIRRFSLNEDVAIAPCNYNIGCLWGIDMIFNKEELYTVLEYDGDIVTFINEYKAYNCGNELGKYPKYFSVTKTA